MDVRRRGVVWFLVLCFAGSWPLWCVAYFGFGLSMANPLVQLPMAFTPAIAAIVVRRWITREGFADAGLRPRVRALWRWYLVAWCGPVLLTVATFGLAFCLGRWEFDPVVGTLPLLMLMSLALVWAYWGEEFGWTSFLRSRIFPGRPAAAAWCTGLIWAVWHWPLPFVGYTHFDRPLLVIPLWTVSFMVQQVALSWLYRRTGSVWVASLAHAGNNMVIGLATGEWLTGVGEITVILLTTAPLAVACAVVWWRGVHTGKADRTGRPARSRTLRRSPAGTSQIWRNVT
jgi:membrane protease YdiL (CAAX protease family)